MAERLINNMKFSFDGRSVNEGFARSTVALFAAQADPSIGVISDIKTVVSEAVTNAIVHGYAGRENRAECPIYISCKLTESGKIIIKIKDKGKGISDIKTAMQPLFTTDEGGERSGMGFTVMESFTDKIKVLSKPNKGTTVVMEKRLKLR